jgi:fatty acid desaturase
MKESFHKSEAIPKDKLTVFIQRTDQPALFRFGLMLTLFVGVTVWVVLVWDKAWWQILISHLSFGIMCCSAFACEHETVHGTAFKSKGLNQWAAFLSGVAHMYASNMFRELHFQHHRHTHVPGLDPEISVGNKPAPSILLNLPIYLSWISGFPLFGFKIFMLFAGAIGMPEKLRKSIFPFVKPESRQNICLESLLIISVYVGIAILAMYINPGFWGIFTGQLVGHCLLASYLIMEHNGLPHAGNILEKTRSIPASRFIKLMMWNMPYHAEHHAYPAVPFHALPALHDEIEHELKHKEERHLSFHMKTIRGFFT